jgi:FtsH-binding integral membrane protein
VAVAACITDGVGVSPLRDNEGILLMAGPWGKTADRRRRREIRTRRARLRAARRSRQYAERRRTEGLTFQEIRRRRRAVWRRIYGTGAALLGAFFVLVGAFVQADVYLGADEPEYSTALGLAVSAAGLYGVAAGIVVVRRARRELPGSFSLWFLAAWTAMIIAIPAYRYGELIGGPFAVTGLWLAAVAVLFWFLRREADD